MKYLLTIRYDGAAFCGFQVQPSVRTVQGTLTQACQALFGCPVDVKGASRTDSGVHALGARVTVSLPDGALPIPADKLHLAIAPHLPRDLSVMKAEAVSDAFHVRYDVKRKQYVYLIHLSSVNDPFWQGRAWQYPYPMPEDAVDRMNLAAEQLVGEQDFSAFMAQGSPVQSTVRHLMRLAVYKEGDMIRIEAEADGFLYNMVRILVGTLVDCAVGRIDPADMGAILRSKKRKRAGETAPPEGLYLHFVEY